MTGQKPPETAPHIARMIRVDQAGEFGATRIYAGQLAVMGDRAPDSAEIAGMAEQEAGHRAKFDALMARRRVRPRREERLTCVVQRCLIPFLLSPMYSNLEKGIFQI